MTNDTKIQMDNYTRSIMATKSELDKTSKPVLTSDTFWNVNNVGEHFTHATEWEEVANGTLAAPVTSTIRIPITSGYDFFFKSISATLAFSLNDIDGGELLAGLNRDIQMNIQFDQNQEYMFGDWIPINLAAGQRTFKHILPQWKGVMGGSNMIIYLQNYATDAVNTWKIKLHFEGKLITSETKK